jgi:hypothetical protein
MLRDTGLHRFQVAAVKLRPDHIGEHVPRHFPEKFLTLTPEYLLRAAVQVHPVPVLVECLKAFIQAF